MSTDSTTSSTTTPDIYGQAVAWFTDHPEEIHPAWNFGDVIDLVDGNRVPTHCWGNILFDRVRKDKVGCSCLTQVHSRIGHAETEDLTAEIRADHRIPSFGTAINVSNLHVFAEWNRKIDVRLGRVPPVYGVPRTSPTQPALVDIGDVLAD